jgi:hypothetical protein
MVSVQNSEILFASLAQSSSHLCHSTPPLLFQYVSASALLAPGDSASMQIYRRSHRDRTQDPNDDDDDDKFKDFRHTLGRGQRHRSMPVTSPYPCRGSTTGNRPRDHRYFVRNDNDLCRDGDSIQISRWTAYDTRSSVMSSTPPPPLNQNVP